MISYKRPYLQCSYIVALCLFKGRYQVTVNGKSVINELNNQPRSYKNVYLYLGSKHPSQDVDRDYYETMDISYEYLKYEPLP